MLLSMYTFISQRKEKKTKHKCTVVRNNTDLVVKQDIALLNMKTNLTNINIINLVTIHTAHNKYKFTSQDNMRYVWSFGL